MNRGILVVICDFLLLSMLALVRFDQLEEEPPPSQGAQMEQQVQGDLLEVLQLSLENEEMARQQLAQELAERENALQEEQRRAAELAQSREQLMSEQEQLQRAREALQRQAETAAQQLQEVSGQHLQLRETLAAAQERQRILQEQLEARERAVAEAQQRLDEVERARQTAERERAILNTRLEAAEVVQQTLRSEIELERAEKEAVRKQAEVLSQNVGKLAQVTQTVRQEITEKIEKATPLSINTVYNQFLQNRVPASFQTQESALIGTQGQDYSSQGLLVHTPDGGVFALVEASGTPFRLSHLGRLRTVRGQLQVGLRPLQVNEISFLGNDPRIIAVRVPPEQAEAGGVSPFTLSEDPLRFETAVVIKAGGGNYGQASFRLNPLDSRYLEMQGGSFSSLFGGAFNPQRGDLVFSRSGAFIGFMVNNSQAVVLKELLPAANLSIGDTFSRDQAATLADRLTPLIPAASR